MKLRTRSRKVVEQRSKQHTTFLELSSNNYDANILYSVCHPVTVSSV